MKEFDRSFKIILNPPINHWMSTLEISPSLYTTRFSADSLTPLITSSLITT